MATIEKQAMFAAPGEAESLVSLKPRYENFVGGHWVAPVNGRYTENVTPATGQPFRTVRTSQPRRGRACVGCPRDAHTHT